jgi:hypothetical protein
VPHHLERDHAGSHLSVEVKRVFAPHDRLETLDVFPVLGVLSLVLHRGRGGGGGGGGGQW